MTYVRVIGFAPYVTVRGYYKCPVKTNLERDVRRSGAVLARRRGTIKIHGQRIRFHGIYALEIHQTCWDVISDDIGP